MTTQSIYRNVVRPVLRPLVVCFSAAVLSGTAPPAAGAGELLVGTGAAGSFSHFVGRAICRIVARGLPDTTAQAMPAETRTDNLTNLNGGSLDLALIDSRQLHDAVNQAGRFAFLDIRYDNLGLLVPLYRQSILLIARAGADVTGLSDVKGKRINAGAPLSATREALEVILEAKGWTRGDFQVVQELPASQGQESMAFCHGTIDALLHVGVHPDAALEQLMSLCGAVAVDLRDDALLRWVENHPAFSSGTLAAGTYAGLDRPVGGIDTTVLLVASGSLDAETAAAVMAALNDHRESLKGIHPALGSLAVDPWSGPDLGVALHPGAEAYFSARPR